MCGIFGIVSNQEHQIGKKLLVGGSGLSYRGYDSVGCATLWGNKIVLRKDVGKIDKVAKKLKFGQMMGKRGIIQLRWATFGAPSKTNAQPHFGCNQKIVGAHNGNIVNNIILREKFKKSGHLVRSTNDGETCVHAFDQFYLKGYSPLKSIQKAYQLLEGDYAYLIATTEENKLYAVKKGSGLVVGLGKEENYISSDLPSILSFTRKIIRIKNGEAVILSPEKIEIFDLKTGKAIKRRTENIKESMSSVQKEGYSHFLLKEIHEQPKVAQDLLHLLKTSGYVKPFIQAIKKADDVYLVGCGTSFHAALLGSYYFSLLAKKPTVPVLGPQFIEQFGHSLDKNSLAIFISQSGETKDIINAVKFAKKKGAKVLGIFNVLGSSLMYESEIYLPLACGYEISVPATKTFLNQIILLLYLSSRMGKRKLGLSQLPRLIEKTIKTVNTFCKKIARRLGKAKDLYYEGYGISHPIALEGALKLKEITYRHCEGIFSSEFKHGPLSAIEKGFPVLFVSAPNDGSLILNHINEVACRHGMTISISEPSKILTKSVDLKVNIPKSNQFIFPILATIPLQLIAYYLSVLSGLDPDFPRNLSKTLTVD